MNLKQEISMMGFWFNGNLSKLHIMKTTEETKTDRKIQAVKIDPSLERYRHNTPFPKKLKEANEMLKTAKLPERK